MAKGEFAALQQRILIWMAVLGSAGITWFTLQEGTRGLIGFFTGATASGLSFFLLHRLTGSIEAASAGQRVSGGRVLLLSLRFLVVGAGLYGILTTYEVSRSGVAAGLLLTVAAVTLANLYDWFRT